jgi:hypothetical protein
MSRLICQNEPTWFGVMVFFELGKRKVLGTFLVGDSEQRRQGFTVALSRN